MNDLHCSSKSEFQRPFILNLRTKFGLLTYEFEYSFRLCKVFEVSNILFYQLQKSSKNLIRFLNIRASSLEASV